MRVPINDIQHFLADYTDFTVRTDLFVGELPRDTDGVYMIAAPSPEPDKETGIEYHTIDFWSCYKNDSVGIDKLGVIKRFFDRRHHYATDSYYVHFSHALGVIEDMDRNAANAKLWKLSIMFILNENNNIS